MPGELKNSNAGAKLPKTRISTLVACNEVGVKRRLLVIGTAKNPRGFPKEVEIPEGFDPQTFLAQVDVEPEDWNLILEEEDDDEEMEMEPEPTTKDPTELLKMVHVLRNDLQSRDGTTSEMLVTLESIERQYVKEVQAKKNLQPKITSFFKQNNNQNSVNNN